MVEVSLVLPAYNEAKKIEGAVEKTSKALEAITSSFEILIAEDGSSDGTNIIASELASNYNYVRHLHSNERLGRGQALNRAFKSAKGDVLAYIDVDLATEMKHLTELIDAIREEGYDFSTGSRMLPKSDAMRSFKRGFASKCFNFFTRSLLGSKLYDHQCGFKAFKREPLFDLLDEVEDKHWFWDTEILVRAQKKGYKIKEFPVKWRPDGETKVKVFKDSKSMGARLIKLWWKI